MVNLIITKAQELGFVCSVAENNRWTIYIKDLKEGWAISQTENEWIFLVKGGRGMPMSNSEILATLEILSI